MHKERRSVNTLIVYVDDADHAQPTLQTMAQAADAAQHRCVLVACAPRITHRVSRFVSNRAREQWRTRWAEKLFAACTPLLAASGMQVQTVLARGPLPEVLAQLQAEHGAPLQVVDLRRPKAEPYAEGASEAPVKAAAPGLLQQLGSTLAGVGALWTVLLSDTLAA